MNVALVTAVSAAATIVALLLVRPKERPTSPSLAAALAPADPVALELLRSNEAPHISGFLPAYARQEER